MKNLPPNLPESLSTTKAYGPADLPVITLNNASRNELIRLLNTKEGTTIYIEWLAVFHDLANFVAPVSKSLAEDEKNNQYQTQKTLTRIRNRRAANLEDLASLGCIQLSLLDDADFIANKRDKSFISAESRAYAQELKAYKAVEHRLKYMGKPDKVKRSYASAIAFMADHFRKSFPGRKISRDPKSLFYKLVCFFFDHCLGEVDRDPEGLIKNFLAGENTEK